MGKKTNSESKAVAAAKALTPSAKAKRGNSEPEKLKKTKSSLAKAATAVAAVAVAAGSALVKKRAATKRVSTPKKPTAKKGTKAAAKPSYTREDVALRAYFISERRRIEGLSSNPEQNWLEAERELHAEFLAQG